MLSGSRFVKGSVSYSRFSTVVSASPNPFYKNNDLYRYDNKNVIYLAYVGIIDNEPIYKYGISSKLYQREFTAHRKHFDIFDMQLVKITDNKDIIEDLFEKEIKIRKIHRSLLINSKKQTELFTTTSEFDIEYIKRLMDRLVKDNPSYEVKMLKEKIAFLKRKQKLI